MTPESQHGASPSGFHRRPALLAGALLLALLATYANHFHNAFHFDDFHTVTRNPAIRSLANVPRFFSDARTFSILPAHYSYRPLISASLALDYWLAKGLDPFWFHLSTFVWYIVQLALMYVMFLKIADLSLPGPLNTYAAIFAVAWYGVHPANAETVNYIVQRGDVYSTLGVIAGLVTYSYWRRARRWGVYLLPVVLGSLAKPSSLVFPALLFIYSLLFENRNEESDASNLGWIELRRAAWACMPAALVCLAMAVFEAGMTPQTFVAGAPARMEYWLTQPIVALHYFKSLFLPTELSADTDRQLAANLFSEASVVGLAFLGSLLLAVRYTLRKRELRPIAFGLLWFLVALLPTSLIPLAEPENDHRMFFPFVGLVLAVSWTARIFLEKKGLWEATTGRRVAVLCGCLCVLAPYGSESRVRNAVWRTEESLWKDVTEKSPHNGRGLMNYGLTQMAKGNALVAYDYFQRAAALSPNYSTLEINLGVAAGLLHQDTEAEDHFRRAIALAPQDSQSYSFYGSWLQKRGRIPEAIAILNKSAELNPADLDPRCALLTIYSQHSDWSGLKRMTDEILRVSPEDTEARRYRAMLLNPPSFVGARGQQELSADNYVSLSLSYCQTGRFQECVQAAKEAVRIRPNYAEAYNNIAAGYQSMGRWDEAIAAAQEAIRLKPDFQLARNNLAYAMSQRAQISRELSAARRPVP